MAIDIWISKFGGSEYRIHGVRHESVPGLSIPLNEVLAKGPYTDFELAKGAILDYMAQNGVSVIGVNIFEHQGML